MKTARTAIRRRSGRTLVLLFAATMLLAAVAGCEKQAPPPEAVAKVLTREAVSVEDGMILLDHPGPKGQLLKPDGTTDYFCDVPGLLNALHDPERADHGSVAFVQPFDDRAWGSYPDGWVRASAALYVLGGDRMGAMGPTIVPFLERTAAEAFVAAHGGRIVPFAEITPTLLAEHARGVKAQLRSQGMMHGMGGHSHAPGKTH